MEYKKSNESNPNNDNKRASNSAGKGGAYIPLEKEKSPSRLKTYLAISVLMLFLGGIGTTIYQNIETSQSKQILITKESKAELVNSILALSDDVHTEENLNQDSPQTVSIEERQKKQIRAKKAIETHIQAEKADEAKASLGLYKGILSRCSISGHDVHWIDENGSILSHVLINSSIDPQGEVAREMINQSTDRIIVVMYEKGYEVYGSNGQLLKTEKD